VELHPFQEFSRDLKAGAVPNNGIDTALRAEGSLALAICLTNPFFDLFGRKDRTAIEASTECAASNFGPVVGRMSMSSPDILREPSYSAPMFVLPVHYLSYQFSCEARLN